MENSALNQLPEVDSLPDGFVESSGESIAPVTPLNEREKKPLVDEFKDKLLVESVVVTNNEGSLGNAVGFADGKLPKLRTFPVPLSENKEGHDDDDADDHGFGNSELKEDGGVMMGRGVASDCASTASVDCGNEKGQSDAERSKKGESDAESTHAKGKQVSESQKNGKETVEGKRKSSKRTFKTEQEFLEFTLKYKQVLAERDAAIAVRDKLESLCRELQRQNKLLMDECKRVSEEGQNLRLDLSTRFQDAIKDVSIKLDEQKEECLSQLKENEMLRDKLKQLADQYTLAQQQFSQELKQKTLELKIAELKVQQAEEKLAHEQVQMKQYAEKISQLLETEKSLRLQLTADGEKFQQFQDALLKSNEVFETFKQEIEKMAKLTKELKRENTFLKSKCEKSDYTLIELVEERERMKKQLEKTKNQKEKLESLCRSLQAERKQSSNGTGQIEPVQQQED